MCWDVQVGLGSLWFCPNTLFLPLTFRLGIRSLVPVSPPKAGVCGVAVLLSKLGLIPYSHFPTELHCAVLLGGHAPEL